MDRCEEILSFWFGELKGPADFPADKAAQWFHEDREFDNAIRERFSGDVLKASNGELAQWAESPRSGLALILLLDQFRRNLFRDSAEAFARDTVALKIALAMIAKKFDQELYPIERAFCYLPLEHSEDLTIQDFSVNCFKKLVSDSPASIEVPIANMLDYAERHREMIHRFGRFPYRNEILGRVSTEEEEEFLKRQDLPF